MLRIGEIHHFDQDGAKKDTRRLEATRSGYGDQLLRIAALRGKSLLAEPPKVSIDMGGGNMKLAGIFVPPGERGDVLPHLMMDVAFQVAETVGSPIAETSIIRKPLIAKFLIQYGFEPVSRATLAEILPRKNNSAVPRIRISARKNLTDPYLPNWYEVQDGNIDIDSGNPIVPIYTRYVLANPDMAMAMRTRDDIIENNRVRIFPKRVQGLNK